MAGPHIDIFAANCGVRRRGFQQGSDLYYLVWDNVGCIISRLSCLQLGHSVVDNAKDSQCWSFGLTVSGRLYLTEERSL